MNMKKALTIILTIALVLGVYGVAHAADTATQSVSFQVEEINVIAVSGDPGTLIITAAAAAAAPGEPILSDPDSSTTYAITTNKTGKKITAKLSSPMLPGLTLMVNLEAPTGATPIDDVELSETIAKDVVTGISKVAQKDLTITYTLKATGEAEPGSSANMVTFTLTDA